MTIRKRGNPSPRKAKDSTFYGSNGPPMHEYQDDRIHYQDGHQIACRNGFYHIWWSDKINEVTCEHCKKLKSVPPQQIRQG